VGESGVGGKGAGSGSLGYILVWEIDLRGEAASPSISDSRAGM
jgi:hypothetical protein